MDVVIVWCKDCVFSQNALGGIRACLEKMADGLDGQEGTLMKPQCFDLHDLHHNKIAVTVRKAKVRIVIITHFFLDHLKTSTVKSSCQINLNRILHSKDVIAILIGIRVQEITDNFHELLPHFSDWSVLELRSNGKPNSQFFKTFSEQVFRSYNNKTKHNETPLRPGTLVNGQAEREQSGVPSILSTTRLTGPQNLNLTCTCDPNKHKFIIKINQQIYPSDQITIQVRRDELDYAGVIQIPDDSVIHDSIEIEAPGPAQYPSLSLLVINQEDDPIDAMIQKFLGYNKYLDEQVAERLLLCFETGKSMEDLKLLNEMRRGKADYFPNLMHFAAYYGLERTVLNLLEKGNGLELCEVRNKFGDTPLDLATRRGYGSSIGQTIRDYEEVMVSWKAIEYIHNFYKRIDPHTPQQSSAAGESEAPGAQPEAGHQKIHEGATTEIITGSTENDIRSTESYTISTPTLKSNTATEIDTISTEINTVSLESDAVSTEVETLRTEIENVSAFTESALEWKDEQDDPASTGPALPVKPPRAVPPAPRANDYDYPPSIARPVDLHAHYAIPPQAIPVRPPKQHGVLEKKFGTLPRDADNYLPIISRGTISISRHLSSTSRDSSSVSSSEDEDEKSEECYFKPVPVPQILDPTLSRKGSSVSSLSSYGTSPLVGPSKPVIPLDPKDEELRQLMEQVQAKLIDIDELGGILEGWKRRSDVQQDFAERKKELERIRAEYEAAQSRNKENSNFLERVTYFFRGRKKSSVPNILQISSPTLVVPELNSSTPPQNTDNFLWPKPNPISQEDSEVSSTRSSDPGLTEHSNMDTTGTDQRRTVSYYGTAMMVASIQKNDGESESLQIVTEIASDKDLTTVGNRETMSIKQSHLVEKFASNLAEELASILAEKVDLSLPESNVNLSEDMDSDNAVTVAGPEVITTSISNSDDNRQSNLLQRVYVNVKVGECSVESTSEPSRVSETYENVHGGQTAPNDVGTPTNEDGPVPPRPPKKKDRVCAPPTTEPAATDCPPSPRPRRNRGAQLQYINYGNISGAQAPPPTPEIQNGAPVPDYDNQNQKL